ncbi:MAG: winged helix-turn-helix transcriptional regulator [Euzebyaceae bacterium]|nr:winged helix-turn-helix transcriptional regulator [Euzebyaceae bacterium]
MLRNMSFDEQGRLTDPRALRAVAHPARLAILELLQQQETATATQCAEHAGLSPSACSYHLRSLARWGLVEEAEGGRGRERPWRARVDRLRVESETLGSESARAAANLFTEQIVLRGEQWVRDFLRRRDRLPSDLRRGCLIDNRFLSLTPAEARDLWQRIDAMLDEYTDKRRDAPDDAVAFRLVLRGFPAAGPQPQADGQ